MLSWAINGWVWGGLVVAYYIIDGINDKYIRSIHELNPLVAANTSSVQWLFGIIGTYICVTNSILDVIPIMVGAWLGTYYTVKWEKEKNGRRKKIRFRKT
jgi:hypothetical protein